MLGIGIAARETRGSARGIVDCQPHDVASPFWRHRERKGMPANATAAIRDARGACLLPAAFRVESWQASLDRRQRRKRGVGLRLVPVGYRIKIIGAIIGVPMFDGGA